MEISHETEKRSEDLEEYEQYVKYHRPADITVFSMTPLARLLSRERSARLRVNMKKLEYELESQMSTSDLAFLRAMLGQKWGNHYSLPSLEFVDSMPEHVQQILPDIQERISILMDAIPRFNKKMAFYFASLPYFLTTEEETIQIYFRCPIN